MKRASALIGAAALLFTLTACATGPGEGDPVTEPTTPAASRFQTTTPGPIPGVSGTPTTVSDARWAAILADLASRGVSSDPEPELVSALAVTWNSGALGCAKPGQNYTQEIVDGMQVIVDAGGTTYDYRFGRTDTPVLCEN